MAPSIVNRRARTSGHRAAAWLIAGAALAFAPHTSPADSTRASFGVGAVVLASAGISEQAVPQVLELTARDVARGFVDRPSSAQLVVTNTSAAGFALDVQPVGDVLSAVEIDGAGAPVVFDATGGSIVERGRRGQRIELRLGFRLRIAPGTPPGLYPFPLAFSVRPLSN